MGDNRPIHDPRIPPRELCILRDMVEMRAQEAPDKTFVIFEDGTEWSRKELLRRVRVAARALQDLGIRQGDRVLVWMPNGGDCMIAWFAINYLGAVYVPINTAYRGQVLEHVIKTADVALAIVHGDLVERLGAINCAFAQMIVIHDKGERPAGIVVHDARILSEGSDEVRALERPIQPWDMQCIIFTSGTTGPSKGVTASYLHSYSMGDSYYLARGEDRYLMTLPMFHTGGTVPISLMLRLGGSIAMTETFNTDNFWRLIVRMKATCVFLMGAMGGFLSKRPDPDFERASTLRWVIGNPLNADTMALAKRVGFDIFTIYGMTEVPPPLVSPVNPTLFASCGRPLPGVSVRIVDENDCEVATGEIGELLVRWDRPWAITQGYYNNPEATLKAWRNGWFHTGDSFRVDEDGNFFFIDRAKDAIRRRGENISSFEVEREVCAHPAVREAAAVAVKSDIAEDEVLIALALQDGHAFDPATLIEFLRPRMAHFMIPRYIRVLDALPKTPTLKVQKHVLRDEGITADTWDREKAGITIKREKLKSSA